MDYDYKEYSAVSFYKGKGASNFKNVGNSCFMGVSLSVLSNCLGLTHYFLSNEFRKNMGPTQMERKEHSFLQNYLKVLAGLYEKNRTVIPTTIYGEVSTIMKFEKNTKQDVNECLLMILDTLHDSLSTKIDYGPKDERIHSHILNSKQVFYDHFKDNYSIITQLFFGQYVQKIKCTKCNTKEFTYQPFVEINLSIHERTTNIYKLLSLFFKKQIVDKKCEKCNESTKHTLKTKIIKLPKYLIVSFKRFDSKLNKITNLVMFSSELEMSDYTVLLDQTSMEYQMIGVVNHYASTSKINNGHYTNFNRTFDGKWLCMDDNTTTEIPATDVCTNNAYILVYEINEF